MPRLARAVFAGIPHHVTQRGNRQATVFFSNADRRAYLRWLGEYAVLHGLEIIAYCLMTNHVHLVCVPKCISTLERTLKPVHTRYAQRINRAHGWKGHLWQGRYFSCALDGHYLLAAVRYVERNPVRSGLVDRAESYRWSSAAARCGDRDDPLLARHCAWNESLREISDWRSFLSDEEPPVLDILRRHAAKGLPCGSEGFVGELERISGRILRVQPKGRPARKAKTEKGERPQLTDCDAPLH